MTNKRHYIWSAYGALGSVLIGLVGNIVIARHLDPADYGLIAMLAFFLAIAMSFSESGLADHLVRDPDVGELDYATVLTFCTLLSASLYLVLVVAAPAISAFYGEHELTSILRVMGLVIVLKGLSLADFARLRRNLDFKRISTITIASSSIAAVVGIYFAVSGWYYWALVAQTLTFPFAIIVLLALGGDLRTRFGFSWRCFREMRGFSANMLASYLSNELSRNLAFLVIGKTHASSSLGAFYQAENISKLFFRTINNVLLTTSYSIIASERDSEARTILYVQLLERFSFFYFWALFLLFGISEPIVKIVFGVQWSEMGLYLQLSLLVFLFRPLTTINSNILKVENQHYTYRNLSFLRNLMIISSLLFTFEFSLTAILYGLIFSSMASAVIDICVCGRYANVAPSLQFTVVLKNILPPIFAMLLARQCLGMLSPDLSGVGVYVFVYMIIFFVVAFFFGGKIETLIKGNAFRP